MYAQKYDVPNHASAVKASFAYPDTDSTLSRTRPTAEAEAKQWLNGLMTEYLDTGRIIELAGGRSNYVKERSVELEMEQPRVVFVSNRPSQMGNPKTNRMGNRILAPNPVPLPHTAKNQFLGIAPMADNSGNRTHASIFGSADNAQQSTGFRAATNSTGPYAPVSATIVAVLTSQASPDCALASPAIDSPAHDGLACPPQTPDALPVQHHAPERRL